MTTQNAYEDIYKLKCFELFNGIFRNLILNSQKGY